MRAKLNSDMINNMGGYPLGQVLVRLEFAIVGIVDKPGEISRRALRQMRYAVSAVRGHECWKH
jgi:hypothetical protein